MPLARITGTARDEHGASAAGAQAVVFSTESRHWSGDDYRAFRQRSARVGVSGSFAIADLPAGSYFVTAVPSSTGDEWKDPRVLQSIARTASRVTLAAGDTRSVDVVVVQVR
jgi:hypothetical protein